MMTKQEIVADLSAMSDLIATARDGLSRNELMNLEGIQAKLTDVVESITDLPPEDAIEMKPLLSGLLTDFKEFSEEVNAKLSELNATVAEETGFQNAMPS